MMVVIHRGEETYILETPGLTPSFLGGSFCCQSFIILYFLYNFYV
jgi:hypothetical protein